MDSYKQHLRMARAATAVGCLLLAWLKLAGLVGASWILVLSPAIVVGGSILCRDVAIVTIAAWHCGCILVARSDAEASRGHTIRGKQ